MPDPEPAAQRMRQAVRIPLKLGVAERRVPDRRRRIPGHSLGGPPQDVPDQKFPTDFQIRHEALLP